MDQTNHHRKKRFKSSNCLKKSFFFDRQVREKERARELEHQNTFPYFFTFVHLKSISCSKHCKTQFIVYFLCCLRTYKPSLMTQLKQKQASWLYHTLSRRLDVQNAQVDQTFSRVPCCLSGQGCLFHTCESSVWPQSQ